MSRNKIFVLVVLLSTALACADDDARKKPKRWWSTPLIMVVYIGFFLIAAGLSFCIRHYRDRRSLMAYRANNQQRAAEGGLGKEEIESLPSLRYSEIKMNQIEKGNDQRLECAVCLGEFKDEEVVRILPDCHHVFHPHCIAPWLASHVTCPICRSSLEHRQGSSLSMSSIFDSTLGSQSQRFDHSDEQNDDNNDGDGDGDGDVDGGVDHVTIEIEDSSLTLHPKVDVPELTSSSTRENRRSYSADNLTIEINCSTTTRSNFISSVMPRESSPKSEYRREAYNKGQHWDCISPKSDSFVD